MNFSLNLSLNSMIMLTTTIIGIINYWIDTEIWDDTEIWTD